MMRQVNLAGSGLHLLSDDELERVGGGTTVVSDDPIIVTAILTLDSGASGSGGANSEGSSYTMDDRPNNEAGSGSSGEYPFNILPPVPDCAKDNKALQLAAEIKAQPDLWVEHGALIYKDPFSNTVQGTGIFMGSADAVSPSIPSSVGYVNILGHIHDHGTNPSTGDVGLDARWELADMYPSPVDWAMLSSLAFSVIAAGGSASQLSVYIVDRHGAVREYNWSDMAIYNVPQEQLLQEPGQPPLPPLPPPVMWRSCGG